MTHFTLQRLSRYASWIPSLILCGIIFWSSGRNYPKQIPDLPLMDKAIHFCVYAVLSALFRFALQYTWPERDLQNPKRMGYLTLLGWIAVCLATLYGIGDEIHQAFVPGRMFDPRDMLADGLGGYAGTIGYDILVKRIIRRQN